MARSLGIMIGLGYVVDANNGLHLYVYVGFFFFSHLATFTYKIALDGRGFASIVPKSMKSYENFEHHYHSRRLAPRSIKVLSCI